MKQYTEQKKSQTLFGLSFVEIIPSPQSGFFRGVFLANHLASTDNLTRITKDRTHSNENYQQAYIKHGSNQQQHNEKLY